MECVTSVIVAIASTITAITAVFAYLLARKNLNLNADQHQRAGVSVVFRSIKVDKAILSLEYLINNRSSVDLLIQDAKLFVDECIQHPHSWYVTFHKKKSENNWYQVYEITHQDRKFKNQTDSKLELPFLGPNESMKINIIKMSRANFEDNLLVGKVLAKLCYKNAKTMDYNLTIPNMTEIEQLFKRESAKAKG